MELEKENPSVKGCGCITGIVGFALGVAVLNLVLSLLK
jgi:hypothetical protein